MSISDLKIKKILLPIDGSEPSFHASRYAFKIAKSEGASVICIHVSVPVLWYGYELEYLVEAYNKEVRKSAEEWFAKIRKSAEEANVSLETEVIVNYDSVVEGIVRYAEEKNVDLIVMGTRGRSQFKRLLLGSIANGVLHHAKCPVLIVR